MDFDMVMNLFWIWIWHGTIQPARNDFAQKLFSKQLATSYAHMEVKTIRSVISQTSHSDNLHQI